MFEIVGGNLADHQSHRLGHADEDLKDLPIPGGETGRGDGKETLGAGLTVPLGSRRHPGGEVFPEGGEPAEECLPRQPEAAREPTENLILAQALLRRGERRAIGDARQGNEHALHRGQGGIVAPPGHLRRRLLEPVVEGIDRRLDEGLERLAPLLEGKLAGVDTVRHAGDADVNRLCEEDVEHLVGPPPACFVAVEDENETIGIAPQELGMALAERRAEDGDDVIATDLPGREAIGVALDDDRPACPGHGVARAVEAVEKRALREHRRLGGVDVFRPLGRSGENAATEGDTPSLRVADREHHPVAEAVVVPAALLPLDGQASAGEQFCGKSRRRRLPQEPVPGRRGVAELESLDRLEVQAAVAEVGAGRFGVGGAAEVVGKSVAGPVEDFVERFPLVNRDCAPSTGEIDAGPLGELLEGFAEFDLLHSHQKAVHVTRDVAHPAAEGLPLRIDVEAWLRVVVPGTEADKIFPLQAERDVRGNEIGDVGGVADALLDVIPIGPGSRAGAGRERCDRTARHWAGRRLRRGGVELTFVTWLRHLHPCSPRHPARSRAAHPAPVPTFATATPRVTTIGRLPSQSRTPLGEGQSHIRPAHPPQTPLS